VYTGRSSCWTTASSFRQPPSTRCSTVSARYLRLSHLCCRWTDDVELVPKQFAWAGHANWLFSSYTEDVSFWSVLGTLSALEALLATMRYIKLTFTFICSISIIFSPNDVDRWSLHSIPWGFPPNILAPPPKSPQNPILADFSMQTYCRESAALVPREWSYEAENLQLYRIYIYRQVLARVSKFFH